MASISLNLTQKDLEEAVLAYAKAKGFEVTERARVSFHFTGPDRPWDSAYHSATVSL